MSDKETINGAELGIGIKSTNAWLLFKLIKSLFFSLSRRPSPLQQQSQQRMKQEMAWAVFA